MVKKSKAPVKPGARRPEPLSIEAEIVPGLEDYAAQEVTRTLGRTATLTEAARIQTGKLTFRYTGSLPALGRLRTIQSVYLCENFPIPRPKALLSNEYLPRISSAIQQMHDQMAGDSFKTFHISAAGRESSVMQRIAAEIGRATGLTEDADQGDLWIRIRPSARSGWDVLIRIGSRPLATREWRVCNYEGALNATVAHTMSLMAAPRAGDAVLNMGAGSASLLIERAAMSVGETLIGVDHDDFALRCAAQNLAAAHIDAQLLHGDMRALPMMENSVDVLLADLPFGQLSGSHSDNLVLYPAALEEAARVAKAGARFVAITHEVRLFEQAVERSRQWRQLQQRRITLRGLHPRIYLLERV